jgi:hypothetical protein
MGEPWSLWHGILRLSRELLIWDNIEWRYRFPELVRRGGKLVVITGLKCISQ